MKKLILPILLTPAIWANNCSSQQIKEAEMFWKQSIHQESNHALKFKTLDTAYKKCPLKKIAVDRYIAYVFTLSKKEKKTPEIIENLLKVEQKNQELNIDTAHIQNNQKKINKLLGRSKDGTLKAVEEIGGVYHADIRFDKNSAKLKQTQLVKEIIEKIRSEVSKSSNAIFGLEGGASSEGRASYNKELSIKRANALKEAIVKKYPNLLTHVNVKGNGEKELICKGGFVPELNDSGEATCITKEDKEASRRVTIRREQ